MKAITTPTFRFICSCGTVNEGDEKEFRSLCTMPPTYQAECAWCGKTNVVSPGALVQREAIRYANVMFPPV